MVCGRFINFKNSRKILNFFTFGCPTDHGYAIVRASTRATHVVHAGDLVPEGTRLVTPDPLAQPIILFGRGQSVTSSVTGVFLTVEN